MLFREVSLDLAQLDSIVGLTRNADAGVSPLRPVTRVLKSPETVRDGPDQPMEEDDLMMIDKGNGSPSKHNALMGSIQHLASSPPSFIVWRLLAGNRVLELRRVVIHRDGVPSTSSSNEELELEYIQEAVPVQFMLPSPVLPSPRILEDVDTLAVHVLLVTSSGALFRIYFESPALLTQHQVSSYQIKALRPSEQREYGMEPSIVHFPDMDTACVSCRNGVIIQVDCPRIENTQAWPNDYLEQEVVGQNYISQLMNTPMKLFGSKPVASQRPSSSGADHTQLQPLALDSITHNAGGALLFGYCRDGKIRVFNTSTKQHIKTVSVESERSHHRGASAPPTLKKQPSFTVSSLINSVGGLAVSSLSSQKQAAIESVLEKDNSIRVRIDNYIKIFGAHISKDSYGSEILLFHLCAYVPANLQESDCAGAFVFYRGEVDASGHLRAFDTVGTKSGPSAALFSGTEPVAQVSLLDFQVGLVPKSGGEFEEGQFQIWTVWKAETQLDFVIQSKILLPGYQDSTRKLSERSEKWYILMPADSSANLLDIVSSKRGLDLLDDLVATLVKSDSVSVRTMVQSIENYAQTVDCMQVYTAARTAIAELGVGLDDDFDIDWSHCYRLIFTVLQFQISQLKMQALSQAHVLLQESDFDVTPLVHQEWATFINLTFQVDQSANILTGIALSPMNSLVLLLKRESISTARQMTPLEITVASAAGTVDTSMLLLLPAADLVEMGFPTDISDRNYRNELSIMFSILERVRPLGEGLWADLSEKAFANGRVKGGSQLSDAIIASVKRAFAVIFDSQETAGTLKARLETFADFPKFMDKTLAFVSTLVKPDTSGPVPDNSLEAPVAMEPYGKHAFAHVLFAKSFRQFSEAFFAFVQDLLIVNTLWHSFAFGEKKDNNNLASMSTLLSLWRYGSAINWMCNRTVVMKRRHWMGNDIEVESGDAMFADGRSISLLMVGLSHSPAAAQEGLSMLRLGLGTEEVEIRPNAWFKYQAHQSLAASAEWILRCLLGGEQQKGHGKDYEEDSLIDGLLRFAKPLLTDALLPRVVGELLEYLPPTAACEYLQGRVFLSRGLYPEAETAFKKASTGVLQHELDFVLDKTLKVDDLHSYYEHVLELFEVAGAQAQIAVFAQLSLSSLSSAERSSKQERVKTLWKLVFSGNLENRKYEEAYAALLANPDAELRQSCIRRFVAVLCEDGEIEALCFNFAYGELLDEVIDTLEFKAKTRVLVPLSEVVPHGTKNHNPNYNNILYAFYVSREEYREAALVQFEYAQRLGLISSNELSGTSPESVWEEQSNAYLASLNALSLLEPDDAWIVTKVHDNSSAGMKRKRRKPTGTDSQKVELDRPIREVVTPDDIRKIRSLVQAKILVAETRQDLSENVEGMDEEHMLGLLLEVCQYEAALDLGHLFKISMETVFGHLAARCVNVTLWESEQPVPSHVNYLDIDVGVEGSYSSKLWHMIRKYVDAHDSKETGFTGHKAIANYALAQNSNFALPPWLVDFFKNKNPEDLIRACVNNDALAAGSVFTIGHLQKKIHSFPDTGNIVPTHHSRWIPYTAICQLQAALKARISELDSEIEGRGDNDGEDDENLDEMLEELESLRSLSEELDATLDEYVDKVEDETRILRGGQGVTVASVTDNKPKAAEKPKAQPALSHGIFSRLGPQPGEASKPPAFAPSPTPSGNTGLKPGFGFMSSSTSSSSFTFTSAAAPAKPSADVPFSKPAVVPSTGFSFGKDSSSSSSSTKSAFGSTSSSGGGFGGAFTAVGSTAPASNSGSTSGSGGLLSGLPKSPEGGGGTGLFSSLASSSSSSASGFSGFQFTPPPVTSSGLSFGDGPGTIIPGVFAPAPGERYKRRGEKEDDGRAKMG